MRRRTRVRIRRAIRLVGRVAISLLAFALFGAIALGLVTAAHADTTGALRGARILAPDHLRLQLGRELPGLTPQRFRFTEERSPDVPIEITSVTPEPGGRVLLAVGQRLEA